jgi:autotransporter-associated beta strand protein
VTGGPGTVGSVISGDTVLRIGAGPAIYEAGYVYKQLQITSASDSQSAGVTSDVGELVMQGGSGQSYTLAAGPSPATLRLAEALRYTTEGATATMTTTVGGEPGRLTLTKSSPTIEVRGSTSSFEISARMIGEGFRKEGAGKLRLTGANSFTGVIDLVQGVLEAVDAPSLTGATVRFASGANLVLQTDAGDAPYGIGMIVEGDGSVALSSNSTSNRFHMGAMSLYGQTLTIRGGPSRTLFVDGAVMLTGNSTLVSDVNVTISAPVGESAAGSGWTKDDVGTMIFTGSPDSYSGLTRVNAGLLVLAKGGASVINGGASVRDLYISPSATARLDVSDQINDGAQVTVNGTLALGAASDAIHALVLGNAAQVTGAISAQGLSIVGADGSVRVAAGNSQIAANLNLKDTVRFDVPAGAALEVSGQVRNHPGSVGGMLKIGPGRLSLTHINDFAGMTTVNDGVLELNAPGGRAAVPGDLTVSGGIVRLLGDGQIGPASRVQLSGAAAVVEANGHNLDVARLAASAGQFKVGTTTGGSAVLRTQALELSGGGVLDLGNNRLIVDFAPGDAAPVADVRDDIRAGRLIATALGNLKLGYTLASDALGLTGAQTGTFAGQTVDATSLLVGPTRPGDTNMDGAVDFNDLVRLAQHYNDQSGAAPWYAGDFTYNGTVDFGDLVQLAQNYGVPAPAGGTFAAPFDQAVQSAFAAAVPEPASFAPLAWLAACACLRRRRRGPAGEGAGHVA